MQFLAAEIEEAVLETHVLRFVGLFVRNVDRRHFGCALHDELVRLDLDFAGWQIGIDRVGSAEFHFAGHRDDGLEVRLFNQPEETATRVDDHLGETVMVAQIDEEDSAVIAKAEHPTGNPDGFARVGGAELVASMSAIRMHRFFLQIEPYYTIFLIYYDT